MEHFCVQEQNSLFHVAEELIVTLDSSHELQPLSAIKMCTN